MKTRRKTKPSPVIAVPPENYRVYSIRWLQLIIYALVTFCNGIFPSTFSPIESQATSFFAISTTQNTVLVVISLFLYAPGTVLSMWAFQRFSMRTVMIIGSLMNLGAWIRLFSLITPNQGYAALVLGQILPGLSAPIFFNAAAQFSTRWFARGQRDIITAVCSMANPLGLAFGFLFPSLIITNSSSSGQFLIVFATEAGFATVIALIVIISYRSSPPTPPSASDQQQASEFKRDFLLLLKNGHYLVLLFAFSIGFGLFNALISLLYELIQPSGYSSSDAGLFGAVTILSGLVSAAIAGVIMDCTHAYLAILKLLSLGACGSVVYFVIILRPSMFYPLGLSFVLMGFFLLPLLPIVFECAIECTYPICSAWSIGLLLCVGNVLGGVFTFVLKVLIEKAPNYTSGVIFTPASIFIFSAAICSTLILLFYHGPYLRLKAETENVVVRRSPVK
ncbi:unnamed protein product [Rotaria magnacalcarata]|uniref:Major facilitator superfamily (MFS) profile domain-containing protein n=1 Tax=Rotaria magnacalcarata TaxID=392030 RepID=A0A815RK59_9BILA|nr:unnamed protein product [Rotaria magnacalcarata]CAF1619189.1 unnamed protein product [Rotaria magnacalcarata]CAF3865119.1 unnamed protein product [Rotaria magnacalcarata]CAF3873301.1 unnamed protein product [Rotaria magnacalcarata]